MRRIGILLLIAASGTGCSTMSNTEKGVGVGGLLGAGVGTAIGAATGNPKTGAVVGGLVGAGVGGAVGSDADERDRERAHAKEMAQVQQATAVAQAQKMGMIDVVQINENRIPNDVIVAMQQARPTTVVRPGRPRTVVVQEPETVIYERPIYRPVYVAPPGPHFGVTYIRRW